MYKRMRLIGIASGAALLFAVNANSTSITTTSYPTWNTPAYITGSATEITFPSASSSYPNNQITIGGFTFTGGPSPSGNTGPTATSINITTPAGGETAMFFFVQKGGGTTNQPGGFSLILSDGESFPNLSGTFGFSSTSAITSATLNAASGSITLYDFLYGTSSQASAPTAEAGTLLLTCGGLLILFGSGRKLFQRTSA
jgi:hypothetical protein